MLTISAEILTNGAFFSLLNNRRALTSSDQARVLKIAWFYTSLPLCIHLIHLYPVPPPSVSIHHRLHWLLFRQPAFFAPCDWQKACLPLSGYIKALLERVVTTPSSSSAPGVFEDVDQTNDATPCCSPLDRSGWSASKGWGTFNLGRKLEAVDWTRRLRQVLEVQIFCGLVIEFHILRRIPILRSRHYHKYSCQDPFCFIPLLVLIN